MGFFDLFKRKKEITPAVLRAMMQKLRDDIKATMGIENETEREDAIKALLLRVEETDVIVDKTLAKVEANIEDLRGRTFWASMEAVNSDLRGLSKGKENLLATKEELARMKVELSGPASEKEEEQGEPGLE